MSGNRWSAQPGYIFSYIARMYCFQEPYDEDTHFLERVHYAGNWDVLRPAREVFGVNPITESEINALLQEAERIIDKLRVTA